MCTDIAGAAGFHQRLAGGGDLRPRHLRRLDPDRAGGIRGPGPAAGRAFRRRLRRAVGRGGAAGGDGGTGADGRPRPEHGSDGAARSDRCRRALVIPVHRGQRRRPRPVSDPRHARRRGRRTADSSSVGISHATDRTRFPHRPAGYSTLTGILPHSKGCPATFSPRFWTGAASPCCGSCLS